MKKLIAIDFETATSRYNSACSIGIVEFDLSGIKNKEYHLICPPDNQYSTANSAIHSLTASDTQNAPMFAELWTSIKHWFENSIIFAHNAVFDMNVLKSTLDFYDITHPEFDYICTMSLGRNNAYYIAEQKLTKWDLVSMCSAFGIEISAHHNAQQDAVACAEIAIKCIIAHLTNFSKPFSNAPQKSSNPIFGNRNHLNNEQLKQALDMGKAQDNANFKNKTFVFTGELQALDREQAHSRVILGGGNIASNVSSKTDVLVNCSTIASTKLKAALELQQKGKPIKIINDEQFMSMLKSPNATA